MTDQENRLESLLKKCKEIEMEQLSCPFHVFEDHYSKLGPEYSVVGSTVCVLCGLRINPIEIKNYKHTWT